MGSVVIAGSTSGTVTITPPAEAGTRTITLPAATGTAILEDGSNNLQINSGFGSSATAYGVRAFVNFNGTGTVAIRKSGNVSSITDNGTGAYTANFATAMPDTNFTAVTFNNQSTGTGAGNYNNGTFGGLGDRTTTSVKMFPNAAGADSFQMDLIIVR